MKPTAAVSTHAYGVVLEDGTKVTIRPLRKEDKVELARFFLRVPEEDRFYLKENVTAPEVIHEWTENIDPERVVPFVAVIGERIVADATLHRSRSPSRRHLGELRIVVDPAYRGRGVASRLIDHMISIGRALGLEKLVFELVDLREGDAIRVVSACGFDEVAVIKDRVKDMYGGHQSLVIMERSLL